jgi:hypothetical protein
VSANVLPDVPSCPIDRGGQVALRHRLSSPLLRSWRPSVESSASATFQSVTQQGVRVDTLRRVLYVFVRRHDEIACRRSCVRRRAFQDGSRHRREESPSCARGLLDRAGGCRTRVRATHRSAAEECVCKLLRLIVCLDRPKRESLEINCSLTPVSRFLRLCFDDYPRKPLLCWS